MTGKYDTCLYVYMYVFEGMYVCIGRNVCMYWKECMYVLEGNRNYFKF